MISMATMACELAAERYSRKHCAVMAATWIVGWYGSALQYLVVRASLVLPSSRRVHRFQYDECVPSTTVLYYCTTVESTTVINSRSIRKIPGMNYSYY